LFKEQKIQKKSILNKSDEETYNLNNKSLIPAAKKYPILMPQNSFNLINIMEEKPRKKSISRQNDLNQKSDISRNLKFKFEKILKEKENTMTTSPKHGMLEHFSELNSILDEDILKQNLSNIGYKKDENEHICLEKPFLFSNPCKTPTSINQQVNLVTEKAFVPFDKSDEKLKSLFKELPQNIKPKQKIPKFKVSPQIPLFNSKLVSSQNVKLFPSNILREKVNLSNKNSSGNFISSFILKKPFLNESSLEIVKENLSSNVKLNNPNTQGQNSKHLNSYQ
jgi:hypothetical protein